MAVPGVLLGLVVTPELYLHSRRRRFCCFGEHFARVVCWRSVKRLSLCGCASQGTVFIERRMCVCLLHLVIADRDGGKTFSSAPLMGSLAVDVV